MSVVLVLVLTPMPMPVLVLVQATEAIVDFALAAKKPFAVVPCCVYQARL